MNEHAAIVEGQRVRVRLDAEGKPIGLSTACWAGGDAERIANLAVSLVIAETTREAARKTYATRHAERTANSTRTKQERASAFWGNQWLSAAHKRDATLGARRLALAARKLIADEAGRIPEFKLDYQFTQRAQINEYRASRFLHPRPPA